MGEQVDQHRPPDQAARPTAPRGARFRRRSGHRQLRKRLAEPAVSGAGIRPGTPMGLGRPSRHSSAPRSSVDDIDPRALRYCSGAYEGLRESGSRVDQLCGDSRRFRRKERRMDSVSRVRSQEEQAATISSSATAAGLGLTGSDPDGRTAKTARGGE